MARLDVDFPEDLLSEILTEDTKDLCKQIVDSAAPILEEAMKKEMRAVIQHSGDSEAVDSIKASKAVESKNGAIISFTGPTGKSTNYYYRDERSTKKIPVTNALKAIWLNYGRIGQPARPFLTKATNSSRQKVMEKMQQTYDRLTGGGGHGSK